MFDCNGCDLRLLQQQPWTSLPSPQYELQRILHHGRRRRRHHPGGALILVHDFIVSQDFYNYRCLFTGHERQSLLDTAPTGMGTSWLLRSGWGASDAWRLQWTRPAGDLAKLGVIKTLFDKKGSQPNVCLAKGLSGWVQQGCTKPFSWWTNDQRAWTLWRRGRTETLRAELKLETIKIKSATALNNILMAS